MQRVVGAATLDCRHLLDCAFVLSSRPSPTLSPPCPIAPPKVPLLPRRARACSCARLPPIHRPPPPIHTSQPTTTPHPNRVSSPADPSFYPQPGPLFTPASPSRPSFFVSPCFAVYQPPSSPILFFLSFCFHNSIPTRFLPPLRFSLLVDLYRAVCAPSSVSHKKRLAFDLTLSRPRQRPFLWKKKPPCPFLSDLLSRPAIVNPTDGFPSPGFNESRDHRNILLVDSARRVVAVVQSLS